MEKLLTSLKHKAAELQSEFYKRFPPFHDEGSPWARDVLRQVYNYDKLSDVQYFSADSPEARRAAEQKASLRENPEVRVNVTQCSKNPLQQPHLHRCMELFKKSQDVIYYERLIDMVTDKNNLMVSMEVGNQLAGALLFRPNLDDHYSEILALGVLHSMKGQGIGGYLIRAMEDVLIQNDIDVSYLYAPVPEMKRFERWGYTTYTKFVSDWMAFNSEGIYRIQDWREYERYRLKYSLLDVPTLGLVMEKHLNPEVQQKSLQRPEARVRSRLMEIESLVHYRESLERIPKDLQRYGIYQDTKHPRKANELQKFIRQSFLVRKQMNDRVIGFWPKTLTSKDRKAFHDKQLDQEKLQEIEDRTNQRIDIIKEEYPGIDYTKMYPELKSDPLTALEQEELQLRRQRKAANGEEWDSRDFIHLSTDPRWYTYHPEDEYEMYEAQRRIRNKIEFAEDFDADDLHWIDRLRITDQELVRDYYKLRFNDYEKLTKNEAFSTELSRDQSVPKLFWERLFDTEDPIQDYYDARTSERRKSLEAENERQRVLNSIDDPYLRGLVASKKNVLETVSDRLNKPNSASSTPLLELRMKQLQTLFGDDLFGVVTDLAKDSDQNYGLSKSERGIDLDNYRTQTLGTSDNPLKGDWFPNRFDNWGNKIPDGSIILGIDSTQGLFTTDPKTGQIIQSQVQLPPVGGIAGVPVQSKYSASTPTGSGYVGGRGNDFSAFDWSSGGHYRSSDPITESLDSLTNPSHGFGLMGQQTYQYPPEYNNFQLLQSQSPQQGGFTMIPNSPTTSSYNDPAPYGYHPKSGLPLPPPGHYAPGVGYNTYDPTIPAKSGGRAEINHQQHAVSGYENVNKNQSYEGYDRREQGAPATGFGQIQRFFTDLIYPMGDKEKSNVRSFNGLHDHEYNNPEITGIDDPRYRAMVGEDDDIDTQQSNLHRMAAQARKAKLRRDIKSRDTSQQEYVEAAVLVPKRSRLENLKSQRNWKLLQHQSLDYSGLYPPPIPLPDGSMPHHHNYDPDAPESSLWLQDDPDHAHIPWDKVYPPYLNRFPPESTQPQDYRLESFRDWRDFVENVHPDMVQQLTENQRTEFERIKREVEKREALLPLTVPHMKRDESIIRLQGLRKLHHDEWKRGQPHSTSNEPHLGNAGRDLNPMSQTEQDDADIEYARQLYLGTRSPDRDTQALRPIIPEELGRALFDDIESIGATNKRRLRDMREIEIINEQTLALDKISNADEFDKQRDLDIKERYKRLHDEHRELYQKRQENWEQDLIRGDIMHENYKIQTEREAWLISHTELAPQHLLPRHDWDNPHVAGNKWTDDTYHLAQTKDPWYADGQLVPEAFWHPL